MRRRLAETINNLPGTTFKEEIRQRNDAINAVAAHFQVQEGGAVARGRPSTKRTSRSTSAKQSLDTDEISLSEWNYILKSEYYTVRKLAPIGANVKLPVEPLLACSAFTPVTM